MMGLFMLLFFTICVILILIAYIKETYKRKSKRWKNCGECEFYYLKDVAGCGDCCWYGCELDNNIVDRTTISGNNIKYRKCKDYKEK